MNNGFNLYYELRKKLRVCKLTSGHTEINIRCPFCGDSIHDPNKGHMYIQSSPPYKFFCQRCNIAGILNTDILKSLDISDNKIFTNINHSYVNYIKTLGNKYGKSFLSYSKKKLRYIPNRYNRLEKNKISYFNKRLGIELEENDINKYKIILNLKDFFNNNDIDINKRLKTNTDKKIFNAIQNDAIGFLSSDRSTINCRFLHEETIGKRYIQYSIYPDNPMSKKLYTISNNIDITKLEHNIILTEGVFDIIGVYNHILNKNDEYICIASNGKSYENAINHLTSLSILNCNIFIYSDRDVPIKFYTNIMRKCLPAKYNGLNIYYNNLSKDFGVTQDQIELSSIISL